MTELTMYQIDAFTQEVFKGNPAAVVPLDSWLPDDVLQQIAGENNLAETAFFVKVDDGYKIRWFTPLSEAPLCGHATLASAYVLFNELGYSQDTIHFKAQLSDLFVRREGDLLILDFPMIQYEACDEFPAALLEGLSKTPSEVYVAHDDPNYYAIFDNESDVRNMEVDLAKLSKLHPHGVVISAPGSETDCVSRYFAPGSGIPEDPVTGSIHCVLVPHWSQKLKRDKIHAYQASPRTGNLYCERQGNRIHIAGYATKYLSGTIFI